ncbi:hypothetical protein CY35_16G005900 [Sphagnum magellanicum]|nr:hypothetical protein CY35_16G005900 [Sphagnum magellanicum]
MTLKGKGQPQAYGDETYWDSRYSNETRESFDWYQNYMEMSKLINLYLPKADKVLMVGCGNAAISEDMVKDGYQNIMNIDISAVVVEAMTAKYKDIPQLKYQKMDVRSMKAFKDGEFDSVLDKVLTFEKWQCGNNAVEHAAATIQEVRRVLKLGGKYMLITYGDPRVRIPHLKTENFLWEIAIHVIPRSGSHRAKESTLRVITDPVTLNTDLSLNPFFNLDDPDLHYTYVCTKCNTKEFDSCLVHSILILTSHNPV